MYTNNNHWLLRWRTLLTAGAILFESIPEESEDCAVEFGDGKVAERAEQWRRRDEARWLGKSNVFRVDDDANSKSIDPPRKLWYARAWRFRPDEDNGLESAKTFELSKLFDSSLTPVGLDRARMDWMWLNHVRSHARYVAHNFFLARSSAAERLISWLVARSTWFFSYSNKMTRTGKVVRITIRHFQSITNWYKGNNKTHWGCQ